MTTDRDKILEIERELAAREPIFHRPEFGTTRAEFDTMMAKDFWEVGASGQAYSREFVLETLTQRHRQPLVEQWHVSEFACQCIGEDLYLATYLLDQSGRISRRATLWRKTPGDWHIVYHQGTLVAA